MLATPEIAGLPYVISGALAAVAVTFSIAQILSVGLMLRYSFGMDSAADELEAAVETVLDDGWRTVDIADERTPADHVIGTTAMGDRIVEAIRAGSPSTRE